MTSLATEEPEDDQEEEEEEEEDDAAPPAEPPAGHPSEPVLNIPAVNSLDSLYGLREIGREALCWQLSSAKPGNGVEQIRDQSTDTYWQSDGMSQPHWIQVHFARRVAISHVCLYLDYNLDESYTPKHLSIQVGMTTHDLAPAIYPPNTIVELNEPVGWCIIPLTAPPDPLDVEEEEEPADDPALPGARPPRSSSHQRLVRTHLIQISIISMHQNGRDTHVRQVQLYGPRTAGTLDAPGGMVEVQYHHNHHHHKATQRNDAWTMGLSQYSVIR